MGITAINQPDTRPYELAVLRGCLDRVTALDVASRATPFHFHFDDTLAAYRAFMRMHFGGKKVDAAGWKLELVSSGDVQQDTADAVVDSVLHTEPSVDIVHTISGLGKLQGRRKLLELTEFLATDDAMKNNMAEAYRKINEFLISGYSVSTEKKPESLSDSIKRIMSREGPAKVWSPGLGEQVDALWKIRNSSYTVIAGDSGSGKTAMLVNMVLAIARQGTHVGVISIEMTTDELTFRASAIEAGVNHERVEDNVLTAGEREQIAHAATKNAEVYNRIHVMDPAFISTDELPGAYNDLVTKYGCEVIFIDYIQRIGVKGKNVGPTERVQQASEMITALTKQTGVATIALSVMSRDSIAGAKAKKGLDHLKHSGQIGHDAHTVVVLSNLSEDSEMYSEQRIIELRAVKVRKGRWFCEPLLLDGPTQRICHSSPGAYGSGQSHEPS